MLVQHNKVGGLNLNDVYERHMDGLVASVNESPFLMVDETSYEPEVDTIDLSREIQVQQASEVSPHVLLVTFEFQAIVSFTYFLPRSEYAGSEEQARKITILDANWNDYVTRLESATVNSFQCRLTFNTETKETDSFEVESVANAV